MTFITLIAILARTCMSIRFLMNNLYVADQTSETNNTWHAQTYWLKWLIEMCRYDCESSQPILIL